MTDFTDLWAIERPTLDEDPPDIPLAFRRATDRIDQLLTPLSRGVIGARPPAGKLGQRYIATDQDNQEYLDIGSGWLPLNPPRNITAGDVKMSFQPADHGDWKLIDGRNNIPRSQVSADYLYLALANGWNGADGTKIGVPDGLGRMPVMAGIHVDCNNLGDTEGEAAANRRPRHKHTVNDLGHYHPHYGQIYQTHPNAPGDFNDRFQIGWGGEDRTVNGTRTETVTTGVTVGPQVNVPLDGPAYLTMNFFIYVGPTSASIGGGGGGGLAAPADVPLATANLAAGAGESGTVPLGAGYRLLKIVADHPCRVRLYTTPAKRDADAARPVGTDPPDYPAVDASPNHGCMVEVNLTAANLEGGVYTQDLAPNVAGSSGEAPRKNNIAYRVDNTDVAGHVINVTFTSQKMEDGA